MAKYKIWLELEEEDLDSDDEFINLDQVKMFETDDYEVAVSKFNEIIGGIRRRVQLIGL